MASRQTKLEKTFELDTYSALDIPNDANLVKLPPQKPFQPAPANYEFKQEAESLIFFTQPKGRGSIGAEPIAIKTPKSSLQSKDLNSITQKTTSRPATHAPGRCFGYDRFREYQRKESMDSSLDFKVLTPQINRDKGPTMGSRPAEPETKTCALGPGQYNPKPFGPTTPAPSFSKSKREFIIEGRQNDSSYLDIFPSTGSRKKSTRGYSFSQHQVDRGSFSNASKFLPGPGHYTIYQDVTKPRPASFSISCDSSYYGFTKTLNTSNDVQFMDPRSTFTSSGFQKFSKADRFPDKAKFRYKRIIFGRTKSIQPIVKKNKMVVGMEKFTTKLNRIAQNSETLKTKIESAQKIKEKLEEDEIVRKIAYREEAERRRLVSKEKANTYKLARNWILLTSLGGWLKELSDKYHLKRSVKKRTDKFMRILFVCLWAVGRIRKKAHAIQMRKATRSLRSIVSARKGVWYMQRRIRSKRRIAKFVDDYTTTPLFLLFIMRIGQRIVLLQRWFRRYLVKKYLMLAIMNTQWSIIEYAVLRAKLNDKDDVKTQDERIDECIAQNKKSDVVPVYVRLYYLKQHLNTLNESYAKQLKKYNKKVEKMRQEAIEEHELKNIENDLKGLKKMPLIFKPPPPPIYHVFIRRQAMVGLINKALVNRLEWDKILIKEKPLPISKCTQGKDESRLASRRSTQRSKRGPKTDQLTKTLFSPS